MKRFILPVILVILIGVFAPAFVFAQESFDPDLKYAQVRAVEIDRNSDGSYDVDVTVRHADEGWDHYADRWEIVNPETGEIIAVRELLHPHVNEQPFTRSITGVEVPEGIDSILVRARCNLHGFEGRQVVKELPSE